MLTSVGFERESKTAEYFARVKSTPSRVMDIASDGFQKSHPDEPDRVYSMYDTPWDSAPPLMCFKARDKELYYGTQHVLSPDKHLSYSPTVNPKEPKADQVSCLEATLTGKYEKHRGIRLPGDEKPPSWLKTWEKYDWSN